MNTTVQPAVLEPLIELFCRHEIALYNARRRLPAQEAIRAEQNELSSIILLEQIALATFGASTGHQIRGWGQRRADARTNGAYNTLIEEMAWIPTTPRPTSST